MSNDARYDDAVAGYYFRESDERALLTAFATWFQRRIRPRLPGDDPETWPDARDVESFLAERRKGQR